MTIKSPVTKITAASIPMTAPMAIVPISPISEFGESLIGFCEFVELVVCEE